ncbi:conserved hypothetical protein [Talaromyces stipitatus ATCC 10500]|uniref:ubiquitinyl hydrolase 1 n=1 Tax=Talaromyces stipitatus (strain ATCC 10500 / CBS 375.48 / QM 6759 / NRRL 1006) TaxID=441959 RepID=B8M308_TALSN|nr:uncharacterized protein TSTA_092260 [Talaromyces stipitatus ATCC 10500]EED21984.1 conserved hypothetical protein [Talaromyces stipitatus ATCC 10500]
MASQETNISPGAATYLVHHIFLPPKLPGSDDYNAAHEVWLVEMLYGALSRFKSHFSDNQRLTLASVAFMLEKVKQTHDSHGHVDEPKLKRALQELCEKAEAHEFRHQKRQELGKKKEEYSRLMGLYDRSECDYVEGYSRRGRPYRSHSNCCGKCRYERNADAISIDLHEWPLPDSDLQAKNAVFELRLPYSFGFWRQTTFFVFIDVFGAKYKSGNGVSKLYHLRSYAGLVKYFVPFGGEGNVGLSSSVKPHTNTHYRNKKINVFDSKKQVFVGQFEFTDKIVKLCTYTLPTPSSSLQKFMSRPSLNRVIASQSDCPTHFTLEEYKALASIPLGFRVQWQNILVQLAMPAVDFRKQETALVIAQAIYQAGPASAEQALRRGHVLVEDLAFMGTLLIHIRKATERIKGNWESYNGVWLFIALTTRVLSLSSSEAIQHECLAILDSLRSISFEWVSYLKNQINETDDHDQKRSLVDKALTVALICAGSFDCDEHFLTLLLGNQDNGSVFLQCSLFIQEKLSSDEHSSNDPLFCILQHRWKRLCQRSCAILQKNVVRERCASLDHAIKNHWSAYQAGLAWAISECAHHWLQNESPDGSMVNFNLLTGELLVDGIPVGYLPNEYRSHATYQTLFGRTSLEVMPSSVVGMQGCIIFCPKDTPWASLANPWKMEKLRGGWVLSNDSYSLLSFHSESNQAISNVLSPLEDARYINCTVSRDLTTLEIDLPSPNLQFYAKIGELEIHARQYPGMVIDDNQLLGTLVGLHSKLILRPKEGNRLVVTPSSKFAKRTMTRVHSYTVDEQLSRLVDNGSLHSKLFLCYLHALTSFCLVDPLTMRTGTEQALSILQSAAVKSFDRLTKEDIDLLAHIAKLSPGREYYPRYLHVIQVVTWDSVLSYLSQHGHFLKHVQAMFEHYDKMKIFHEGQYVKPWGVDHAEEALLNRDLIRSSMLRISGFGAEDHTLSMDAKYTPRDRGILSAPFQRAFRLSSFIYNGRTDIEYALPESTFEDIWKFLRETSGTIPGPMTPLDISHLRYDAKLILSPSEQDIKPLVRGRSELNKYHVMMWLATMAFSESSQMTFLQIPGTFSSHNFPDAPAKSSFNLLVGSEVVTEQLRLALEPFVRPIGSCPESRLTQQTHESVYDFWERKQSLYQSNCTVAVQAAMDALCSQWPCETPTIPPSHSDIEILQYVNVQTANTRVREIFNHWYSNFLLRSFLKDVCNILKCVPVAHTAVPSIPEIKAERIPQRKLGYVPVDSVFEATEMQTVGSLSSPLSNLPLIPRADEGKPLQLLHKLIHNMSAGCASEYERLYLKRLQESLVSLQDKSFKWNIEVEESEQEQLLRDNLDFCRKRVGDVYRIMVACVSPSIVTRPTHLSQDSHAHAVAFAAGQWPRIAPILFLEQLARQKWCRLSNDWKDCIVSYGVALTQLHRAARLCGLAGRKDDLIKQLQNHGHQNWDPRQYPESLLLEVENGIMIREVQQEIVIEIVNQTGGTNHVMQLNMGEKKSSVIVPILASVLANPSCLIRIIVAKPQSRQMLHVLTSKLGGLINRRVYHLPFFRGIRPSESDAVKIEEMCRECMTNGGVLLVQPEQLLSFELMCSESLIEGNEPLGRALLKTQQFFDESTRDIVDESDENFSTKFELVYAMGTQKSIELSPDRWLFIQTLLSLVGEFATQVQNKYPLSIEVNPSCPGSFPRTRLLRSDAQIDLIDRLARKICDTGMKNLPIYRQSKETRQAIFNYIVERHPSEQCTSLIQDDREFFTGTTRSLLLLLRGLLAGGVLASALQRCWRVAYGLDPHRSPATKLAVPYRGKDNPTARSEFSDPDTVIMLTCLSYYYEGLSDKDLYNSFTHVTKSDQGPIEYEVWVKDAPALAHQFRQLEGVSLQDRNYCVEHIFPALRYSKGAIDYFLAHIVFPKEMKEFPLKLSASGWDIGRIKTHPTSGFSGTNDSRDILPLSVRQLDLTKQKHTNALVLGYLLQPENSVEIVNPTETDITNVCSVLQMVTNMTPPTQVILDVGAQILESNQEVAKEWLKLLPEARCQAIVFIDDNDELNVLDRKGIVEPLLISPFAKQMENFVMFTLTSPILEALTYDCHNTIVLQSHWVLTSLKTNWFKSVVFLVSEEVQTKIRSCVSKTEDAVLNVSNVLRWAISETMIDTCRNIALWAVQGSRYHRQRCIWEEQGGRTGLTSDGAKQLLEPDAQTIEKRYNARTRGGLAFLEAQLLEDPSVEPIIERCRQFADLDIGSSSLYEEQERELAPEIEQEREIKRPESYEPAKHMIHEDLRLFIRTGSLDTDSSAFMPAFKSLSDTTAARHLGLSNYPQNDIIVTKDFVRTVEAAKRGSKFVSDSYQRQIQWILTSVDNSNTVQHLAIISPYEADVLLPDVLKSSKVTLHLYPPRSSLAYQPLDHLMLYTTPTRSPSATIPRQLITQLNLLAGQLYLSSYDEYLEICKFLNLASGMTPDGWTVAADGFILNRGDENTHPTATTFQTSPVQFFKILIAQIRRNCEDIDKTHIGRILNGGLLEFGGFLD